MMKGMRPPPVMAKVCNCSDLEKIKMVLSKDIKYIVSVVKNKNECYPWKKTRVQWPALAWFQVPCFSTAVASSLPYGGFPVPITSGT